MSMRTWGLLLKMSNYRHSFSFIVSSIIFALIGFSFFAWLTFLYITFSIAIWNVTPAIINQTYGSLPVTVVTFLNNIMFYIFGSFAYKVSSIILFSIGATAFWTIISIGPALVKLILKKK